MYLQEQLSGVAPGQIARVFATNLPDGWVTTDVLGRSAPFALVAGTDVNLAVGLVPVDAIRTTSAALGPIDAAGGDDGARLVIAPSGGAPGTEVATIASCGSRLVSSSRS